jgi:DNA (cytosine-5)-methyltransferase 1
MKQINVLSLFSGIGGLDISAEWAGMKTVAFCEIDDYACKVLEKRWPNVPIYRDVRELTGERLQADGIETVDIVCGGFPCPAFSRAGKQGGFEQDNLFYEILRLCREIIPKYIVMENVEGFIKWRDTAINEVKNIGYDFADGILDARDFGVPQARRRWFGLGVRHGILFSTQHLWGIRRGQSTDIYQLFANASNTERRWTHTVGSKEEWRTILANSRKSGDDNGVSNRMDRLRCLGNAVSPAQFYPIFKAIMEVEHDRAQISCSSSRAGQAAGRVCAAGGCNSK